MKLDYPRKSEQWGVGNRKNDLVNEGMRAKGMPRG
jgi:hypothetical protein